MKFIFQNNHFRNPILHMHSLCYSSDLEIIDLEIRCWLIYPKCGLCELDNLIVFIFIHR